MRRRKAFSRSDVRLMVQALAGDWSETEERRDALWRTLAWMVTHVESVGEGTARAAGRAILKGDRVYLVDELRMVEAPPIKPDEFGKRAALAGFFPVTDP